MCIWLAKSAIKHILNQVSDTGKELHLTHNKCDLWHDQANSFHVGDFDKAKEGISYLVSYCF